MRHPLASLLLLLLLAGPARAQTGVPAQAPAGREVWERSLDRAPGLVPLVHELADALKALAARDVAAQFRDGKVGLLFRRAGHPRGLYAHSQATALLGEFLAAQSSMDLRVSIARLEGGGRRAHVALDLQGRPALGGRQRRERIVAIYELAAPDWRLAELQCP